MNKAATENILMVSNYPSDTAYAWWFMEHFWKTIASYLDSKNGVSFLAFPKITNISDAIKNTSIHTIELCVPGRNHDEIKKVRAFIKDNNIKYIYFTDRSYFNVQYFFLRKLGIKTIIVHDHTPGDRPPIAGIKGALKSIRNNMPLFTADYIFCVSNLMRQRCLQNSRIPARKCYVIQNGIPPVECEHSDRSAIRNELGIDKDAIVITTTGRAHPYKRFDFIIKCAAEIHQRQVAPRVVFLLIGDGPAMPDLQEMVIAYDVIDIVKLQGFRKDIRKLLCASDIALHAALGECFSLSIVEYMSAGLPVLVPDIPSVCQAITNNRNGYIYPKNEIESVVQYIEILSLDRQKRLDFGRSAKDVADNKYNISQCTESFVEVLRKALSCDYQNP